MARILKKGYSRGSTPLLKYKKLVYQTEYDINTQTMSIHEGDKDTPVLATANLSRSTEGITPIQFLSDSTTIEQKHVHHKLCTTSNTYFTFNGKAYHWKSHAALLEDRTNICLAVFRPIYSSEPRHRIGSIIFTTEEANGLRDMIVITRLVDMARSDEAKLTVSPQSMEKLIAQKLNLA